MLLPLLFALSEPDVHKLQQLEQRLWDRKSVTVELLQNFVSSNVSQDFPGIIFWLQDDAITLFSDDCDSQFGSNISISEPEDNILAIFHEEPAVNQYFQGKATLLENYICLNNFEKAKYAMVYVWLADVFQSSNCFSKVKCAKISHYGGNYFDLKKMAYDEVGQTPSVFRSENPIPIEELWIRVFSNLNEKTDSWAFISPDSSFIKEIGVFNGKNERKIGIRTFDRQGKIIDFTIAELAETSSVYSKIVETIHQLLGQTYRPSTLPNLVKPMRLEKFSLGVLELKLLKSPLEESKIIAAEKEFSSNLPPDFRTFLQRYNGGVLKSNGDAFLLNPSTPTMLQEIFGIHNNPNHDLVAHLRLISGLRKTNEIAIGWDMEKRYILMSLRGNDAGSIYLWDHYTSKKYLLATSFQEWVDGIYYELYSAYDYILQNGQIDVLKKRLEESNTPDACDRWGRWPIDEAVENYDADFFQYLWSLIGQKTNRFWNNYFSKETAICYLEQSRNTISPQKYTRLLAMHIMRADNHSEKLKLDTTLIHVLIRKGADIDAPFGGKKVRYFKFDTTDEIKTGLKKQIDAIFEAIPEKIYNNADIITVTHYLGLSFDNIQPSDNNEVTKFEKKYDIQLPDLYRSFLTNFNGGLPNKQWFIFTVTGYTGENEYAKISRFLNVAEITALMDDASEQFNKTSLPVALDEFGGYIKLNCKPDTPKYHWLFYAPIHVDLNTYDPNKNRWLSFDNFLQSLSFPEEIFDEITQKAMNGDTLYFQERLKNRWRPNVFTITGKTPLQIAVRYNQISLVKLLLDSSANPYMRANSENAFDLALKYSNKEVKDLVFKYN